MSSKDLLKFLFVESANNASMELDEYHALVAEEMDKAESMETQNGDLKKVLSKLDISSDVEVDPERGHAIDFEDAEEFNKAVAKLRSVEGLTELGEAGWIASVAGDIDPEGEELSIIFTSIGDNDLPDNTTELADVEKLAKDSYEFVNDPLPDREDEKPTQDKGKGVGDAKDGEKPKSVKEARESFSTRYNRQMSRGARKAKPDGTIAGAQAQAQQMAHDKMKASGAFGGKKRMESLLQEKVALDVFMKSHGRETPELWWDWFMSDTQLPQAEAALQAAFSEVPDEIIPDDGTWQVFAKENPALGGGHTTLRLFFSKGEEDQFVMEVQVPSGDISVFTAGDGWDSPIWTGHTDNIEGFDWQEGGGEEEEQEEEGHESDLSIPWE